VLVEWVVVLTVHLNLPVDVQALVRLPPVAWSDIFDAVEDLVVLSGLLQVELVAGEGQDGEALTVLILVLLDHRIEVNVLLGIG